jgi:hypothetical protein
MGNNGFTIEYPPLHQLMTSKNKVVRTMVDFMTYLNPEPHRETFLKPFMVEQSSEFCSTCHKVHLDIPVNNYRWFRGFNDYDNWQASGFGEGRALVLLSAQRPDLHGLPHAARTFEGSGQSRRPDSLAPVPGGQYRARQRQQRRRAACRRAEIPHLRLHLGRYLRGFPGGEQRKADGHDPALRNGPKAEFGIGRGRRSRAAGRHLHPRSGQGGGAPRSGAAEVRARLDARVDVVVRTRKIGHFFPGGTLDSFDIWLELQATDATGKTIFWSGQVEDGGKGPVEPGAHFYKAYQLDGDGNEINKRNAWQARSVLYVHAIQPGAADTVHYLLNIPKDAKGPIHLTAKLNHRKFSWYYTQFAYAGKPKPGEGSKIDINHNAAEYSFDKANIPANVSGEVKGEDSGHSDHRAGEGRIDIDLTNNAAETKWRRLPTRRRASAGTTGASGCCCRAT